MRPFPLILVGIDGFHDCFIRCWLHASFLLLAFELILPGGALLIHFLFLLNPRHLLFLLSLFLHPLIFDGEPVIFLRIITVHADQFTYRLLMAEHMLDAPTTNFKRFIASFAFP